MTGLGTMLRFTLRRERVRIPVYVLVLVALIASTAAQSEQLYPTAASRADYVTTVEANPGPDRDGRAAVRGDQRRR